MRPEVIAWLAALAVGCAGDAPCGPTSGTVARVIDGDTIELASGETLRYLLVDTPESTSEVECYGAQAAEYNRQLVEGMAVALRYDEEACEDRFGRVLAYVTVGEREINALLVERGFGCVLYLPPGGAARAEEFASLEAAARAGQRGLWGACEEVPCD